MAGEANAVFDAFAFLKKLDGNQSRRLLSTKLRSFKKGHIVKGKSFFAVGMLLVCALGGLSLGQSVYSTISGTVEDPTKALIPGVALTATNTATGIVTTAISNEAGVYSFPSLQPGTYKVTAELPGFQTETYTDVQLG